MRKTVKSFLSQIENQAKNRVFPKVISSSQDAYFIVEGKKKMNLCSSHYLGFAVDNRLKKAAQKAIDRYGLGTGYRTLAGTNILNTTLEQRLAEFKEAEDAIVLPSGYLANMTAIQTLLEKEDIIISDQLNHASIIDAVRLSGVKNKFIYKHSDMDDLEKKLQQARKIAQNPKSNGKHPQILIVTDGVFSMDGDLAPLPKIYRNAQKYDAMVMVDDAHGEGVLGDGGRGIVHHFGLTGKIDIEVGTLSKAFSVIGGFITGKRGLIQYYKMRSRQFMFSSAMTVPDTAAVLEAVKILSSSDRLVAKLWKNTDFLKKSLVDHGFDIGSSQTPITPIMLGDEKTAVEFAEYLFKKDIFASAIVFPMVPKGASRIRLIPSASHSIQDLKKAIQIIAALGRDLRVV